MEQRAPRIACLENRPVYRFYNSATSWLTQFVIPFYLLLLSCKKKVFGSIDYWNWGYWRPELSSVHCRPPDSVFSLLITLIHHRTVVSYKELQVREKSKGFEPGISSSESGNSKHWANNYPTSLTTDSRSQLEGRLMPRLLSYFMHRCKFNYYTFFITYLYNKRLN